eukprot:CAMPEP_0175186804 /NCGR_PEP_ID=MMETSP0093-20121207/2580_1 /TAXON_ID=311494 /ORGANISM="Alexandrium monilatum, Strain CCMP3105" /LENGTH=30 /DNA_ID= /DNA_START= /DNA_END= /DNA_ORIENTATION=
MGRVALKERKVAPPEPNNCAWVICSAVHIE